MALIGKVSMNLSARYTTQSSVFDRLLVGASLTDRRISKLQAEGFYGKEAQALRLEQRRQKQQRKKRIKSNLLEGWV